MNLQRWIVAALCFGVMSMTAAAPAQERPDFSGQWTDEPEPAPTAAAGDQQQQGARRGRGRRGGRRFARVGDMGSGWGSNISIETNGSFMTVEYAFFSRGDLQPPLKFTYAIGGNETTNTVMMGRGIQEQVSTAAWDEDALVITTTHAFIHPGTGEELTCDVTRTLSLNDEGRMIVEVNRDGVLGGEPVTTRTVYRRRGGTG